MLEQGPDFWCWFDTTQFSYIYHCVHPICFQSKCYILYTFQSNCAEGLHFSAFIITVEILRALTIKLTRARARAMARARARALASTRDRPRLRARAMVSSRARARAWECVYV